MLKGCVGDDKLVLCAELEQEVLIVVTVTNAMSSENSLPRLTVLPNSSVEGAKDKDPDFFRSVVQESAQIRIEDVFVCRVCQKSGSVGTEECEVLFALHSWRSDFKGRTEAGC